MPCDAVVVDVVEHGQARLAGLVDVVLGVVWLRELLVSGLAPRVVAPAGRDAVGLGDLLAARRPEPAEQVLRLQVAASLAALEVAQASRRPDVRHVVRLDQTEDQVVLLLRLQRHQVHAVFTADVASVQPVELAAGQPRNVAAQEVVLAAVLEFLRTYANATGYKME